MLKLLCDMDDTLVGFVKSVQETSGVDWTGINMPEADFLTYIDAGCFVNAGWTPGGIELVVNIEALKEYYGFEVELLTSTGRQFLDDEYRNKIIKQKRVWLALRQIDWKLNVVHTEHDKTDKEFKADYANPNSLLIDDSLKNVEIFRKHGGLAIHYDGNLVRIIDELKAHVEAHYNNKLT